MSGKPETGAASATHEDRTRVGERSETANQRTEVRGEPIRGQGGDFSIDMHEYMYAFTLNTRPRS